MPRYFMRLAYDGSGFHGWQRQPNGTSIQALIEQSLLTLLRHPVSITGAGRTDAGVHAREYFAHFDIDPIFSPEQSRKLIYGLNALLPPEIAIYDIFRVQPEAHARYSALSRTYNYIITGMKDPFLVGKAWFYTPQLDIGRMNEACGILMRYHDFSCFMKTGSQAKSGLCRIYAAQWSSQDHLLTFTINANRFLRNMVRAIVGTMVDIGREHISLARFEEILQLKDRSLAGVSAPAEGLYLVKIAYPDHIRF